MNQHQMNPADALCRRLAMSFDGTMGCIEHEILARHILVDLSVVNNWGAWLKRSNYATNLWSHWHTSSEPMPECSMDRIVEFGACNQNFRVTQRFIDKMCSDKQTAETVSESAPAATEPEVSFHAFVKGLLQELEQRLFAGVQYTSDWTPAIDVDGNPDVPDTERQVIVFLCGDRKATDPRPSPSAGYGIRFGWFDTEKQSWRVDGKLERFVTHWREVPPNPPLPADYSSGDSSDEED